MFHLLFGHLLWLRDLPLRHRAGNNVKQGVRFGRMRRWSQSGEPRRSADSQFLFEVCPLVIDLTPSDNNRFGAADSGYFRSVETVTPPGGFGMNGLQIGGDRF